MSWLVTSDLHLSDRPRDGYRFGIFKWLATQQEKYNTTATFILGDVTENKDKHSSALVNRLVDELIGLKPPIYILRGNHDGIDPTNPYFRFLNTIEGVQFIVYPTMILEHEVLMIPHQPNQAALDKVCNQAVPTKAIMLHQTLAGAVAETGAPLNGLAWPLVEARRPLWGTYAGDIHRPQRLANGVTYVGAPYCIRFSDNFTPRVLLVDDGKERNLYYPAPRKWSITVHDEDDILHNEDLHEGDQVMVTIELQREEFTQWAEYRQRVLQACKEAGLEVFGCDLKVATQSRSAPTQGRLKAHKTPEEVVTAFCQAENVASGIKKVGLEFLK